MLSRQLTRLALLYRYAPHRDMPKFRWVTWGSVAATPLWIVASLLFSVYVSQFGSYNTPSDALGAVIILLMWFYITAFVVLPDSFLAHSNGFHPETAWSRVSQREKEILKLLAEGYPNWDIAEMLFISVKTAEKHRSNLMTKLKLHNVAGLTALAV